MSEVSPVEVKCYSGGKRGERPSAVKLEGIWHDVVDCRPLGRKRGFYPSKDFVDFKVILDNGMELVLRYFEEEDLWTILKD